MRGTQYILSQKENNIDPCDLDKYCFEFDVDDGNYDKKCENYIKQIRTQLLKFESKLSYGMEHTLSYSIVKSESCEIIQVWPDRHGYRTIGTGEHKREVLRCDFSLINARFDHNVKHQIRFSIPSGPISETNEEKFIFSPHCNSIKLKNLHGTISGSNVTLFYADSHFEGFISYSLPVYRSSLKFSFVFFLFNPNNSSFWIDFTVISSNKSISQGLVPSEAIIYPLNEQHNTKRLNSSHLSFWMEIPEKDKFWNLHLYFVALPAVSFSDSFYVNTNYEVLLQAGHITSIQLTDFWNPTKEERTRNLPCLILRILEKEYGPAHVPCGNTNFTHQNLYVGISQGFMELQRNTIFCCFLS